MKNGSINVSKNNLIIMSSNHFSFSIENPDEWRVIPNTNGRYYINKEGLLLQVPLIYKPFLDAYERECHGLVLDTGLNKKFTVSRMLRDVNEDKRVRWK